MTQGTIDRLVAERLADAGIRYTQGRRSVVHALRSAQGPESAAELTARLRGTVPVSSLYRTLGVLERTGVVAPHHGARDITRYELGEWLTGHHHHLICERCGRVEDFELDTEGEHLLEELAGRAIDGSGFTETGHTLEIQGMCANCRS